MHDRLEIASRLLAAQLYGVDLVQPADVRKCLDLADQLLKMHDEDMRHRRRLRPLPSAGFYPAQPRSGMFNAGDPVEY